MFGTLILLVTASCASISEYNQGCRDGLGGIRVFNGDIYLNSQIERQNLKEYEEYCDQLEEKRTLDRQIKRQDMSVWGRKH